MPYSGDLFDLHPRGHLSSCAGGTEETLGGSKVQGAHKLPVGLAALSLAALLAHGQVNEQLDVAHSRCDTEARRLFGPSLLPVVGEIGVPRGMRAARPEFPTRSVPTTASGIWIGEGLIAPDDAIVRVWVIREISFRPPWPEFNTAIPKAIARWKYTPTLLDGKAVSVCMTVSVLIHWG